MQHNAVSLIGSNTENIKTTLSKRKAEINDDYDI